MSADMSDEEQYLLRLRRRRESLDDREQMRQMMKRGVFLRDHVERDPEFFYPTRYVELLEPRIVYIGERPTSIRRYRIQPPDLSLHPLDGTDISQGLQAVTIVEYPYEAQLAVFNQYVDGAFDEERQMIVRYGRYLLYRVVGWTQDNHPPTTPPEDVIELLKREAGVNA